MHRLRGLRLVNAHDVTLASTEARWVPVTLRVPASTALAAPAGVHAVRFKVQVLGSEGDPGAELDEKSTFVLPR